MTKESKKWSPVKVIVVGIIAVLIFAGIMYSVKRGSTVTAENPVVQEPQTVVIPEKESWIEAEKENPEFKQQIADELEKRYWLEMKERSDSELLKLQDKGFSGETVSAVRSF